MIKQEPSSVLRLCKISNQELVLIGIGLEGPFPMDVKY